MVVFFSRHVVDRGGVNDRGDSSTTHSLGIGYRSSGSKDESGKVHDGRLHSFRWLCGFFLADISFCGLDFVSFLLSSMHAWSIRKKPVSAFQYVVYSVVSNSRIAVLLNKSGSMPKHDPWKSSCSRVGHGSFTQRDRSRLQKTVSEGMNVIVDAIFLAGIVAKYPQ
jgi:hypothetical protein